jgi:pimeloyl-ACP methyl ester carboxylesterase
LICFILLTVLPTLLFAQNTKKPLKHFSSYRFSQTQKSFHPFAIKGVSLYPDDPFKMDFIIDQGDKDYSEQEFKQLAAKMIRYFLAALTIPKKDLWVNLTPYEKERIIPGSLGETEMGRDLLMQDYTLKQLSASLLDPGHPVGRKFWKRISMRMRKEHGITDMPQDLFNKVWIVPQVARLYEHEKGMIIIDQHLQVMLEHDYHALAISHNIKGRSSSQSSQMLDQISERIVRAVILPEIERAINQGEAFAPLRQIFNSLILATWYKQTLKQSLLTREYADQAKIEGIDLGDPKISERIYKRYLRSVQEGLYEHIRKEYDPVAQKVIHRKYLSGGIAADKTRIQNVKSLDTAMATKMEKGLGRLKTVTVALNREPLSSNKENERTIVSPLHHEALALRQERIEAIREQYGNMSSYPDLRLTGIFQNYLEDLFLPWSQNRVQILDYMRDSVFYPLVSIWSYWANLQKMLFPGFAEENYSFSGLSPVHFMGTIYNGMMEWAWEYWLAVHQNFSAWYPFLDPMTQEMKVFKEYFQKNYLKMMNPSGDYTRKVKKTIDYLHSLKGEKPAFYSEHEVVLQVPGLFKLVRVKTKEGQKVDPQLPPALIIGPHSGHDAESLADYTNKDQTDANSLAQTFKKQGHDTFILVWESSQGLQDIGDLQEAVHLSIQRIGKKVVIGGLCHGGAVGAHYMGVKPDNVAGLIVAGAPVDTHIGDNDVTRFADQGMDMPAWLQFRTGQKDVYEGDAQKIAFKYLGYEGGVHKRITKLLELIDNIDDIDYVERARIFDEWFEYTNNIGYLAPWVHKVFIENQFITGDLTFRLGNQMVTSDPANYLPNRPVGSIGGLKDDITPPPTIVFADMEEISDRPQALWNFLTKGIVPRSSFQGMTVKKEEAFDYLLDNGYLDQSELDDKDYAYVNEEKVMRVMTRLARKKNVYKFFVADFQDRDDTKQTVLPKIQAFIDRVVEATGQEPITITHYAQGIRWLNSNIEIYKVFSRETLQSLAPSLTEQIEKKAVGSVDQFNEEQWKQIAKTPQGVQLRRLIAEMIAEDVPITNSRLGDAAYMPDISDAILNRLSKPVANRFFSDTDPQSVNSTYGVKAVMRMPFAQLAFDDDYEAFRSIDAPFINQTPEQELKRIFDYLSRVRGQSSGILDLIPTKKEYTMFLLVNGGHIGIYNGSRSQQAWVKMLSRFKEIWEKEGLVGENLLLADEDIVLALEDQVTYFGQQDTAMAVSATPSTHMPDEVGGIDLNPDQFLMKIEKNKNGVIIPRLKAAGSKIHIDRLQPSIIHVAPVTNLPALLGIKQ